MKELLEKLLAAIPAYVRALIGLLSGPKKFVGGLDLDSPTALQEALTFLGVSFGLSFIAGIPWLPAQQDKGVLFGLLALNAAVGFILNVAITVLAWKLVGAKFDWKKFILVTCYFSGLATLFFAVFGMMMAGTLNILDPEHYQQLLNLTIIDPVEMEHSIAFKGYVFILCVDFLVQYLWTFCVWATYREIAQLSRSRSGGAFAIYAALVPVVFFIQILTSMGIASVHKSPQLPNQIIGAWELKREGDDKGLHSLSTASYIFSADGTYSIVIIVGTTNGQCLKKTMQTSYGRLVVEGSSFILIPVKVIESTDDGCSKSKSQHELKPAKQIYEYHVKEQTSGWQLCLSNRFGETCLAPKQ